MKYKTLDITKYFDEDLLEGKKEVIIKKISFGQIASIRNVVANVQIINGMSSAKTDIEKLMTLMVLHGLEKGPVIKTVDKAGLIFNGKDIDYVLNLPGELGTYLFDEINAFNTTSPN